MRTNDLACYLEGSRILLIDDSESFQRATAATLERAGAESVTLASTLLEGIRRVHAGSGGRGGAPSGFDLILMDINLQGDDGIRGCEFIARHPATRDIPLVVATGLTGRGIINDAFSAGASDFLQKPVPGELLTVRLGMLLKLRAVDALREAV